MNGKRLLVTVAMLLALLGGLVGATTGQVTQASGGQKGQAGQGQGGLKVESAPAVQTGTAFTYQGRLVLNGSPANGNYDFTFTLYDAATGGNQIGSTITVLTQTLSIGTFSAALDFGQFAFQGDARWLQIGVRVSGDPSFTTLAPRQALTPAPYALSLRPGATISGTVSTALQVTGNSYIALSANGASYGLYSVGGYMGADIIGTGSYGLYATTTYTGSLAVFGYNGGSSGTGVQGTDTSPFGVGVRGFGNSANGYGMIGNGYYGVYGSGNYGFYGYGSYDGVYASSDSIGVYGNGGSEGVYGYGSGYYGVYGSAALTSSVGVEGYNSGPNATGVAGDSNGNYGVGVSGQSNNSNGIGTYGSGRYGAYGYSNGGYGLYGYGYNGDGIYATGTGGGYAGYFYGNVNVTGTCCGAGLGVYKIDDPKDPANKYLNQAAVTAPDMMDIYNGNTTTDAKGEAVVTLPDYFEALNKDFRYQLTPIGQFAQAIVSEEIKDNRFTIKTDKPNVKVSWQVTGVRHDPYAAQHPITPEQDKTGDEQGKYLYPAAYGQPDTAGVEYGKNPPPQIPQRPPAPQLPQQPQPPKLPDPPSPPQQPDLGSAP